MSFGCTRFAVYANALMATLNARISLQLERGRAQAYSGGNVEYPMPIVFPTAESRQKVGQHSTVCLALHLTRRDEDTEY